MEGSCTIESHTLPTNLFDGIYNGTYELLLHIDRLFTPYPLMYAIPPAPPKSNENGTLAVPFLFGGGGGNRTGTI
jgi:hypothetical protein